MGTAKSKKKVDKVNALGKKQNKKNLGIIDGSTIESKFTLNIYWD